MRRAFSWRWVTRLNCGIQADEECRSVSSDRSINSGLLRVYELEVPGITVGGIIIMLLLAICTRRCCLGYLFVNRWKKRDVNSREKGATFNVPVHENTSDRTSNGINRELCLV